MDKNFSSELALKIQSHENFWKDFAYIQSIGIRKVLIHADQTSLDFSEQEINLFNRLLYSASIFAQTETENNKFLAQTIALSIFITATDLKLRSRTTSILAEIGNFPSLKYINDHFENQNSDFLSELKIELLRNINSIKVGNSSISLTDFQYKVWKSLPLMTSGSISAPTSAGKSFLIIEYLCQKIIKEKEFIAVYVAPTRALLAEVFRKISLRLAEDTSIRVSTVPSIDSENRTKQIFVVTQERLHVLLSISKLDVDLVIVDEAQNLADGARGMILQDCLERLKDINPESQLILLSPGAEGFKEVGRLLGLGSISINETTLSPVLQNRIVVSPVVGEPKTLELSLLNSKEIIKIGDIKTTRGVADASTRLAACALELGKGGAALVYATGPADAEETANQLTADSPLQNSDVLNELSKFIKSHIHPKYGLAEMVLHGIAFHYGKMPNLLREAVETAFRSGDIKYLVCTTTLFQGVNLPARSVFINTPTRGRGVNLDAALLWNFAGRAGRLGQDLVGNVFLVDYHKWSEQNLDEKVKFNVTSAFVETVSNHYEKVLKAISGEMPSLNPQDITPHNIRAAAGLMLARASTDQTKTLLMRNLNLSDNQRQELESVAKSALKNLELSSRIIENNWTVNPYGLQRLANRLRAKIAKNEIDDLIPIHPKEANSYDRYIRIFKRIASEILGLSKLSPYGALVATYAIPWMQGMPYPVLLNKWIDYKQKNSPNAQINSLVRTGFEFIEDILRFQMVQLGKAYIDVLEMVLKETDNFDRFKEVFDFALALELGVSTTSGRAFIELGASRITALTLEALFPDSELTPVIARQKLQNLNVRAINLSPIIISELLELGLINREMAQEL